MVAAALVTAVVSQWGFSCPFLLADHLEIPGPAALEGSLGPHYTFVGTNALI